MKIHTLDIQAIGPFATHQHIDFTALDPAGIFLLDGPTGSGKSTILSALTFALYGQVPGDRKLDTLQSTLAAPGLRPEVHLDVSIGNRRFDILRWPAYYRPSKRKRAGGHPDVTEKPGIQLQEFIDGRWKAITTRIEEAAQLLQSVLGLNAEQFMRVILLPQGEFATFLKSSSRDREDLLRKLFGTHRFDQIPESIKARRDVLFEKVESDSAELHKLRTDVLETLNHQFGEGWWAPDSDAEDASAELETLDSEDFFEQAHQVVLEKISETREQQQNHVTKTEAARGQLTALQHRSEALQEFEKFQQRTQAHQAHQHQIQQCRTKLALHEQARPVLRAFESAMDAETVVRNSAEELKAAVADAHAAPLFSSWVRRLNTSEADYLDNKEGKTNPWVPLIQLGYQQQEAAQSLKQQFQQHAQLQRQQRDLQRQQAGITTKLEKLHENRVAKRSAHEEKSEQIANLQEQVTEIALHEQKVAELKSQLAAARELQEALKQQDDLDKALQQQIDQTQAVVDAHQALVQRRIDAAASLLAQELIPGEACVVCGSSEHPAPAEAKDLEEISQSRIEKSLTDVENSQNLRRHAEKRVNDHSRVLSQLQIKAGDRTLEETESLLSVEQEELKQMKAQDKELRALKNALSKLEDETTTLNDDINVAEKQATSLQVTLENIRQQKVELADRLHSALGEYETPQQFEQEVQNTLETLEKVASHHRKHEQVSEIFHTLQHAAEKELKDSGTPTLKALDSHEQAEEAKLDADTVNAYQHKVKQWDEEKTALAALSTTETIARGRKLSEQGRNIPTDQELAEAQEQLAHAETELNTVANAMGAQTALLQQVQRQQDSAQVVISRSAEQLKEYETVRDLLDVLRGEGENFYRMSLGSYVLAGRLEKVAAAASERLEKMTQGRYELEHDDTRTGRGKAGLDLKVRDHVNDTYRNPSTLSGGETFMASLALALGLADTVQAEAGGISMDTLFIDEGFGSLDQETLEQVMGVLEGLHHDGRSIGLVSHVEAMKAQIPFQIQVRKSLTGSDISVQTPLEH